MAPQVLRVSLAGFGGQGILFAGKVMVYAGLLEDKEVAWLPSYGPEMRGGTCKCSVTISERMVGSPLFASCDVLMALNQPSFDKYLSTVLPGGLVVYDSSLITVQTDRDDITLVGIPATSMAEENGLSGLANIIMVGKLFEQIGFAEKDAIFAGIDKCVSAKRPEMAEYNKKAFELGATY